MLQGSVRHSSQLPSAAGLQFSNLRRNLYPTSKTASQYYQILPFDFNVITEEHTSKLKSSLIKRHGDVSMHTKEDMTVFYHMLA